MPTFHDPVADGEEARQALRGLAHATRAFDDPSETYPVIGDLLAGVRSLRQVLDQLANTHSLHRSQASNDDGDRAAGMAEALAAADELRHAAGIMGRVAADLDRASQHSGRIAWQPDPPRPGPVPVDERLAARVGPAHPFTRAPQSEYRGLSL